MGDPQRLSERLRASGEAGPSAALDLLSSSPNWAAQAAGSPLRNPEEPAAGVVPGGAVSASDTVDGARAGKMQGEKRDSGEFPTSNSADDVLRDSRGDFEVVYGFDADVTTSHAIDPVSVSLPASAHGGGSLPSRRGLDGLPPRLAQKELSDAEIDDLHMRDATHFIHFFRTLHEEGDVDVGVARVERALEAFRYSLWELTGDLLFRPVPESGWDAACERTESADFDESRAREPLRQRGQLVRIFLGQIVRLAYGCPVPEYADRFRAFFEDEVRPARVFEKLPKRTPRLARFLPRSMFAKLTDHAEGNQRHSISLTLGSFTESADLMNALAAGGDGAAAAAETTRESSTLPRGEQKRRQNAKQILYDVFLTVGRVAHLHRVIAIHPKYFEIHFAAWAFLISDSSLPLPVSWRAFLMCLTAARFRCLPVVDMAEAEFLAAGGDPNWLAEPILGENSSVPPKLINFVEVLQLLCHQPWLLRPNHIAALCVIRDPDSSGDSDAVPNICTTRSKDLWTVSEVVLAIMIVASSKSLCGISHSVSVVPECDFEWERHLARPPKASKDHDRKRSVPRDDVGGGARWATTDDEPSNDDRPHPSVGGSGENVRVLQLLQDESSEGEGENGSQADTDDGVLFAADADDDFREHRRHNSRNRMVSDADDEDSDSLFGSMLQRGFYNWDSEVHNGDGAPQTEQESLFANLEKAAESCSESEHESSVAIAAMTMDTAIKHDPIFVSGRPTRLLERYCAYHIYNMTTKDFNFKKFKPFRVHMYNWKDDGYALVSRFLSQTMADLLDDEFDCIKTLTYKQFGRSKVATKTKRFREAVWQYAQYVKGMFHDDYDYKEVNNFLSISIKTFVKKSICTPEDIVESELEFDLDLALDEKLHMVLLGVQSARQSEILYGVHAVMRYVTSSQN
jgi:PA26 p53-induced protein (sestrin)